MLYCNVLYRISDGGGRSAVQIFNGTDVVTAGGGGGGADCKPDQFCGGGGTDSSGQYFRLTFPANCSHFLPVCVIVILTSYSEFYLILNVVLGGGGLVGLSSDNDMNGRGGTGDS